MTSLCFVTNKKVWHSQFCWFFLFFCFSFLSRFSDLKCSNALTMSLLCGGRFLLFCFYLFAHYVFKIYCIFFPLLKSLQHCFLKNLMQSFKVDVFMKPTFTSYSYFCNSFALYGPNTWNDLTLNLCTAPPHTCFRNPPFLNSFSSIVYL